VTGRSEQLVVKGWTIFAYPLFLDQIDTLVDAVEKARAKDPVGYKRKNAAKRLAAVARLAFDIIPENPELDDYRQGNTLGDDMRHWLRAKFFQQYRLFFRYRSAEKIILYAWVNDESTLRAYGSKTDAYAVFGRMLARNRPPNDWQQLAAECRKAAKRLATVEERITSTTR
jgi:toxin YhaV